MSYGLHRKCRPRLFAPRGVAVGLVVCQNLLVAMIMSPLRARRARQSNFNASVLEPPPKREKVATPSHQTDVLNLVSVKKRDRPLMLAAAALSAHPLE